MDAVGFILPGGNANKQLELALVAEEAGWYGVFVWEGAYGVDALTLLAAITVGEQLGDAAPLGRTDAGGPPPLDSCPARDRRLTLLAGRCGA